MTLEKFNVRTRRAPLFPGLSNWFRAMLIFALAAEFTSAASFAQEEAPPPIISKIEITGNQRIYADPIRIHISQQVGQPFDQEGVDADIKAIYKMGFFESVTATLKHRGGADVLVYSVHEHPLISDVKVYGTEEIRSDDDKIVTAVKVQRGFILDPVAVKETIDNLTRVYADNGDTDAKVNFKAIPQPDNTVVAVFSVVE